jgi:hypothetical protein
MTRQLAEKEAREVELQRAREQIFKTSSQCVIARVRAAAALLGLRVCGAAVHRIVVDRDAEVERKRVRYALRVCVEGGVFVTCTCFPVCAAFPGGAAGGVGSRRRVEAACREPCERRVYRRAEVAEGVHSASH